MTINLPTDVTPILSIAGVWQPVSVTNVNLAGTFPAVMPLGSGNLGGIGDDGQRLTFSIFGASWAALVLPPEIRILHDIRPQLRRS